VAKPTVLTHKNFFFRIGNGLTVETFVAPCAFTGRALDFAGDTVDTTVPDCDDVDAPVYVERVLSTKSATVTGEGVLSMGDLAMWRAFFEARESRNCRIVFDLTGAQGGGYYQGKFILTKFTPSSERSGKTTISVELKNDGDVTWVNAA
jgi:hypothetical protein